MTSSTTAAARRSLFDPDALEFRADPYPTYHRLRADAPVAWSETHQFWFLSRHADVVAAFNHPALGHGSQRQVPGEAAPVRDAVQPLVDASAKWLLFKDPPDHTRVRRLMQHAFSSIQHKLLVETVGARVDALLEPMVERGQTEFIADFAFPLPLLSMAAALDLPGADHPMLLDRAREIWGELDLAPSHAALQRANDWVVAVEGYFRDLLPRRRAEPGDDLLSAMLAARDGDERLHDDEIVANCGLMLFAGHDTTAHLLGNGMFALLHNPEQLRRLREDREVEETAVAEMLRYISPQQLAFRNALEDVVLAGVEIARGEKICMGIGSANRDPAVFREPDELDFDRPRLNHVAFAGGIHACIGSRLARLTARIAFRRIVTQTQEIRLCEFEWEPTVLIRGLHRLRLEMS